MLCLTTRPIGLPSPSTTGTELKPPRIISEATSARSSLGDAVAGLEAVGVSVMHHTSSGLGHGLDDNGVSKGMEFLAGIFGVDLEAMAQQSGPA